MALQVFCLQKALSINKIFIQYIAFVSFFVFLMYTLMGGNLTPPLAFTVIAVINNFKGNSCLENHNDSFSSDPIARGAECINLMANAVISTKRISDFLKMPEVDVPQRRDDPNLAVQINGDFSWEENLDSPTLKGFLLMSHSQFI